MVALVSQMAPRARPEPGWVARVAGATRSEAEAAIAGVTAHASLVDQMSRTMGQTGRTYYAQFPAPIELYALVRLTGPDCLVETGVSAGVSSTFMLLGAKANKRGVLHSIDQPAPRADDGGGPAWSLPHGRKSGWAIPGQLKRRWRLHVGRSEALLRGLLDQVGPVGFYCHDSPVDEAHFEFEMTTLLPYLAPGAIVVADNVDRGLFEVAAQSAGATPFYRRRALLGAFRVPGG